LVFYAGRAVPQLAQNLLFGGITFPHLGHDTGWASPSGPPQCSHTAAPTLFAVLQYGQTTDCNRSEIVLVTLAACANFW